ncbi:MAG: hypothetical protein ACOWWO_11455 [Peptococcaceae bacterium]
MKKKCLFFLVSLMLIFSVATAHATTVGANLGHGTPSNCYVYYEDTWSTTVSWSPSTNLILSRVPDGAQIYGVMLMWTTSGDNYSGLHMNLANDSESVYVSESVITHAFDGQSPQQEWQAKFYVDNKDIPGKYLNATPTLVIYYEY